MLYKATNEELINVYNQQLGLDDPDVSVDSDDLPHATRGSFASLSDAPAANAQPCYIASTCDNPSDHVCAHRCGRCNH